MTGKQERYILSLAQKRKIPERQIREFMVFCCSVLPLERARVGSGWTPIMPSEKAPPPLAWMTNEDASEFINILKSDFQFSHYMGQALDRKFVTHVEARQ